MPAPVNSRNCVLKLVYGSPSEGNETARERFDQNCFTVTRQLRYSRDETQRALDIALFINGLPVFTFELKNSLTKQTVDDAVRQYRKDRNPRERLFEFGRCVAHFAVDENEARFCTHLVGDDSWFLPFNRGWNDGAGNPPNPNGIKTGYLWREVLARASVTDILENYAQVVEVRDEKTGRKKTQIWPRYHQLEVVRRLLDDAGEWGVGRRYLVQHSAGSGKSNSIAWLAHQLIGLESDGASVFDSIVVVTDRRILDRQIGDTIGQYAQIRATVGKANRAGDLKRFIESGKKIIVSTVQKFPFILDEIGDGQRNRRFAIIIDETHSSQGGETSAAMAGALSEAGRIEEDETYEDRINRIMESRRLLKAEIMVDHLHERLRGLFPQYGARRRNRSRQAARPAGRTRRCSGVHGGASPGCCPPVVVAGELFGVVVLHLVRDLEEEVGQLRRGLVGEVEGDGDEWRGVVVHEDSPRDARDLALRRERAFERLAACSLASRSRELSPSRWTICLPSADNKVAIRSGG